MVVKWDESGQSLLEFLIMLPMMLGLVLILVRVNSAVQVSIVNQQYARSTAHWLAFNSSTYPSRKTIEADFLPFNASQLVVGVSENRLGIDDDGAPQPVASTQQVTRGRKPANDDSDRENLKERALVRVRTTVALCTQVNSIDIGGRKVPMIGNNLGEQSRPEFCRSAQQ
ncbi:MAG: hypothetical protein H7222_06420 [Methylotenera sp.]|nr:hypothetical protein [Oligoflexia bacterium]